MHRMRQLRRPDADPGAAPSMGRPPSPLRGKAQIEKGWKNWSETTRAKFIRTLAVLAEAGTTPRQIEKIIGSAKRLNGVVNVEGFARAASVWALKNRINN